MDIEAAKRFQEHAEQAIKELSSALRLASDCSSEQQIGAITGLMGEIIARIDGLMHESIFTEHPELRTSGRK